MLNRLLTSVFLACLCASCAKNDVVYADIYKVHQEFELQKVYASYLKNYKDSAVNNMERYILSAHIYDTNSLEGIKKSYYEQVQKSVALKTDSLNAIIWKRLNPLIQEFGKENRYRVILGANGSGSLLYSDSSLDVSDDLIQYVNRKYNGM